MINYIMDIHWTRFKLGPFHQLQLCHCEALLKLQRKPHPWHALDQLDSIGRISVIIMNEVVYPPFLSIISSCPAAFGLMCWAFFFGTTVSCVCPAVKIWASDPSEMLSHLPHRANPQLLLVIRPHICCASSWFSRQWSCSYKWHRLSRMSTSRTCVILDGKSPSLGHAMASEHTWGWSLSLVSYQWHIPESLPGFWAGCHRRHRGLAAAKSDGCLASLRLVDTPGFTATSWGKVCNDRAILVYQSRHGFFWGPLWLELICRWLGTNVIPNVIRLPGGYPELNKSFFWVH